MADILAELLALALAIAVSPFAIVPAILLLLSPRALAAGLAYLGGWIAGLVATAAAFALLAGILPDRGPSATWLLWAKVALGVLLVVLGVRSFLSRRTPKPPPRWMESVSTATPARAVRLAVLLVVANPKILVLAATAGVVIGSAALSVATSALAVAVFAVVASASVVLPVVLFVIRGERMTEPLGRARDWLVAHNSVVMAVVLVVIGLIVAGRALAELA